MDIISPMDVAPKVNRDLPAHVDGRRVHRRVVSATDGGPRSIDVGYNMFAKGLEGTTPYAYTKDEFCYTVSGELHGVSGSVRSVSRAGTFTWRPAGAATHSSSMKADTVTICAFGPAREDDWSHRLPPDQVGRWDGQESDRPMPLRIHFSDVAPTPYPAAPQASKVLYREIFSNAKNGSTFMDVSHTTFGERLALGSSTADRDEVSWLEAGQIEFEVGGMTRSQKAGEFCLRRAGETVTSAVVAAGTIQILFSAPAI